MERNNKPDSGHPDVPIAPMPELVPPGIIMPGMVPPVALPEQDESSIDHTDAERMRNWSEQNRL